VTRGGDTTSSVYQIDHYQDQDFFHSALKTPTVGEEVRSIKESFNVTLPEWDFQHHHYRPDYCHLTVQREDPLPTNSSIQAATLTARDILFEKNRPLIEHWRQQFDRLINRRTWMDRQWEGPDFSLDDFVRYYADTTSHHTGDPRVYLKSLPAISDQVTQVIVDQSLSTDSYVMNRRVLDVSLESLQLMSLLFEKTAHPLSIAGVYSHTHRHCSFRLYKDFEDPWSVFLNQIPTIEPQGYTRLGPSLRYATERLLKRKEKFKLILLLTDGKPTDYDLYEGRYGLEDIRQAQREARQSGIHFRAMAIEKQAQHYFPRLFGKNEFFILNDPQFFPEELFKVYWNCWSR
jgi:nitric oxide reductase NorD protein